MTEYQKLTIYGSRWEWIKNNHLNHNMIFQEAIDRLMGNVQISLSKEHLEWIDTNGIDLNFFVRKAINNEIYNNGKKE